MKLNLYINCRHKLIQIIWDLTARQGHQHFVRLEMFTKFRASMEEKQPLNYIEFIFSLDVISSRVFTKLAITRERRSIFQRVLSRSSIRPCTGAGF